MPVGFGYGPDLRGPDLRPGVVPASRFSGPNGLHPGAVWIAAAAPVLAMLLLLARLAS